MKKAVLYDLKDLRLEEGAVPEIAPREVLIAVKSVGICASDLYVYAKGGRKGRVIAPFVLGHECAGVVAAVGAGVTSFQKGDRVAVEPGLPCGVCNYCKAGRYNLCEKVRFMAAPVVDGALREFIAWPEDLVFKLADHVPFEHGAMAEPTAVALYAARRAQIKIGDTVAIIGMGPIGLLTLQIALMAGAKEIFVCDLEDSRLALAKKLGAAATVCSREVDLVEEMMRHTGGKGVDVVLETAGSALTYGYAVKIAARGGRVIWVGIPHTPMGEIGIAEVLNKELDIRGVFRYCNVYRTAVDCVNRGILHLDPLITHRFPFSQVRKAFEFCAGGDAALIKAIIQIDDIRF